MRIKRIFIILTLVGLTGFANLARAEVHLDAPPSANGDEPKEHPPSAEKSENMMIVPAPPVHLTEASDTSIFRHENYYYPFKREIIADIGLVFGLEDSSPSNQKMNLVAGMAYVFSQEKSTFLKWEGGAELSFANRGHLWFSERHVYNEKSAFRPYFSYGLMHNLVPDERFASFSDWDNYLARVAVGMLDTRAPPRSTHLELILAVGAKDLLVTFTYGYAWGN